jgi:hypothetical protein
METTVAASTLAAAATTPSPRDGPSQSTRSRDNLAVVAARNVSGGTVTRSQVLPTPPNSISPALGPHSLRAQLRNRQEETAKLEPVDSDLDLQDTDSNAAGALAHTEAGSITSAMLAKHYLPDILLSQGPLAIRHITGFLTTAVPGFATIPPTKARRLVVAALEGQSGGSESETGEEDNSDIVFEKVGWGRWEAHQRGHPIRHRRSSPPRERAGSPYARALPIPKGGGQGRLGLGGGASGRQAHARRTRPLSNTSIAFSYGSYDHRSKIECETDKMSLDGSASPPCSDDEGDAHVGNDVNLDADLDIYMNDDPEDATDEEDWATMGAAALRDASYPSSAATPVTDGRGIFRVPVPASFGSRSVPSRAVAAARRSIGPNIDTSNLAATSNAQERAAIEALLSLGSM